MQGVSFSSLRAGKTYRLTNHGDIYDFVILEIFPDDEFLLRDLHTLEYYKMSDLIGLGRGKDFSIWEV